jgi:hypothetical protein
MRGKRALNSVLMGFIVSLMFTSLTAFLQQEAAAQESPQSHFRFSHLNWVPTGNPNEVEFEIFQAVRRDGACGPGPFTGPGGLPGIGDICIENQGPTIFEFGDATDTGTVRLEVVSIDVAGNWLYGRVIDPNTGDNWIHTYNGPGPWTAFIDRVARTGLELNNPNSNYRISTLVDLNNPPQPNQSPISTTSPIIQCPVGLCTYPIPAADADGDVLRFRLSTGAESGVNTQPGAGGSNGCANALTIATNTGVVTWDTTGCSLGLYSNSIFIEEKNSATAAAHGHVMVDYLIEVTQNPNQSPHFEVPPMSPSGTNFILQVGDPFSTPVECEDPDGADSVTLGNLGLPAGASVSAQVGTNPGSQTFSFTPLGTGVEIVQFTCQDNNGNNAIPHSYTFNIVSGGGSPVGGTMIPIDTTALIIAGASTNGFWVLSILGIIAVATFTVLRFAKRETV